MEYYYTPEEFDVIILNTGYTGRLVGKHNFTEYGYESDDDDGKDVKFKYAHPAFISDIGSGVGFYPLDPEWIDNHPECQSLGMNGIVAFVPNGVGKLNYSDIQEIVNQVAKYKYVKGLKNVRRIRYATLGDLEVAIVDVDTKNV